MRRLWFAVILCLLPIAGNTQPFPSPISLQVNDLAGILEENDQREVTDMLKALLSDTGIQMTVLTLDSQVPYAPDQSLESFATALFNDWEIGDATRNDGILVLVLPDDRAVRIELGAGYTQSWNDEAGRVIDRSFLPSFRSDKYARGIKDGVADAIATLARPFAKGQPAPKKFNDGVLGMVFAALAAAFIFWRSLRDRTSILRRCPSCGRRGGLHLSRHINIQASATADGSGQKTTRCNNCDYENHAVYAVKARSASSTRGFGGGRSGGGGASGRW